MSALKKHADPLANELAVYNRLLPELLKDEGKYALIFGDKLIDVFTSYEDALKAGYQTAKLKPFLVKKISGTETAMYFTRDIDGLCRTLPSR